VGRTLHGSWHALIRGKVGLRPVERFSTANYIAQTAAFIPELDAITDGTRLPCLLDVLLAQLPELPKQTRLITATTKGAIDALECDLRNDCELRNLSAAKLPELAASRLGLRSSGWNVNAACASGTIGIINAANLIANGTADAAIIIGIDLLSEFVFSGFSALQALSPDRARPFDRDRDGLTLGEGAAAILLMSAECLQEQGLHSNGQIVGWGIAGDANHITAPARDGCGLIAAVEQALAVADIDAAQIGVISAHGTGTVYNDAMELTAYEQVLGDLPPLFSIKGAIGHTLGACGVVEALLGQECLRTGTVPPTAGLLVPAERAATCVSATCQDVSAEYLLSTNSGFGGINAALILADRRGHAG